MASIQKILFRNMLWIALISTVLIYTVWIVGEYIDFLNETEQIRENYIGEQKFYLKNEVRQVVDYIEYKKNQTEERLKKEIRQRIIQAHAVAAHLWDINRSRMSEKRVREIVKEALRPVRFNDGRGYFFAFRMDGIEELFADRPEMEGRNMLQVQGADGEYVVRDMIRLLQEKKQGFYQYTWTKPNQSGKKYKKIAFVKYFEPFDWGIGTGEYIEDVQKNIQDEILERISKLRFGKEGYFFGSVYGGKPLFTNGKITTGSANIWELTDPNGVKLIQKQNRAAKQPGGGYVAYQWRKLGADRLVEKLSYVKAVPKWEWVIGAGIYLDTVDAAIAAKKASMMDRFRIKTLVSLGLLLLLLSAIYLIAERNAGKLQAGILSFSRFFQQASTKNIEMDPESLEFEELSQIAASANQMIKKHMETLEALKFSEKRYAAIADSAQDSIFCKDLDRKYTFVNKAMADLFNCTPQDLIGKTPEEIFDVEAASRITSVDDRTFAGESVSEIRTLSVGGQDMAFHTIQVPLEVENGVVKSISGIVRDITAQKKAEKANLDAEHRVAEQEKHALVGQIAGKISHDFNNILGIIMGNAEIAMLDCTDPEIKEILELIYDQTRRGKNLTRNLVAFAKDHEPKQEFFKLTEKVDLVLSLLKKEMDGIHLVREYQADLPEILADPGMIEHAAVNLVLNAMHALSLVESPKLIIRIFTGEDHVWLEIEDNGCGIPETYINHIFDPSFTLKGSRDSLGAYHQSIKGTGYGLANVKKYVEQHQGRVSVASQVDKGTIFRIGLPVTRRELTPVEIESFDAQKMAQHNHILIVEDEPAILNVQYRLLTGEPCGHVVDTANDGNAALDLIHRNQYDCISLDYVLPGTVSGMDIYTEIRKKTPETPVLFISGNIEFLESIKAMKKEDPNLEHISKPCSNVEYIEQINRLLCRRYNNCLDPPDIKQ